MPTMIKNADETLPQCWFTRSIGRRVVIDGKRWPWLVNVPVEIGAEQGDVLRVPKSDGSFVYVRLVTFYPLTDPKQARERDRWTFVSVEEDGSLDSHSRKVAELDAQEAARKDLNPEDGRPVWWSRKEDGTVRWPVTGQVWSDRESGALGVVVRDRMNRYQVGWYPMLETVVADQLETLFPDGVPRNALGEGEWMASGELMDNFTFVWKVTTRTERIRAWAKANGYAVKDKGSLPKAVIEAYEAVE